MFYIAIFVNVLVTLYNTFLFINGEGNWLNLVVAIFGASCTGYLMNRRSRGLV